MKNTLRLNINKDKPESENRWFIERKVITKTWWFLPDKVKWLPLTCSEVGYPRYGVHLPTDISYFFDHFCASAACLKFQQ
jgi:hypothetical protein